MNVRILFQILTAIALLLGATSAQAQFGGLGKLVKKAGVSMPTLQKAPITTGLDDAKWAASDKDGFVPSEEKRSMLELQRTPNGGFVLQPGYWSMNSQSYCLKAGTHGPGGGDGYLYAPPIGPAEDAVTTILRNSVNHPEISQRDIQTLLWAIIARAKFEDLSTNHKAVAARLLTPRQLASLNRSALDMLSRGPLADNLPKEVRMVLQAEADLRRMLTSPATSFAELEQVAVLAGMAGIGEGSRETPLGRWNLHPEGYYVRYLPKSYNHTVLEVWVPKGSPAVGKEIDPAMHIAVPGNTARQRLIQSGRAVQNS